jgi:hypothetical protein
MTHAAAEAALVRVVAAVMGAALVPNVIPEIIATTGVTPFTADNMSAEVGTMEAQFHKALGVSGDEAPCAGSAPYRLEYERPHSVPS